MTKQKEPTELEKILPRIKHPELKKAIRFLIKDRKRLQKQRKIERAIFK